MTPPSPLGLSLRPSVWALRRYLRADRGADCTVLGLLVLHGFDPGLPWHHGNRHARLPPPCGAAFSAVQQGRRSAGRRTRPGGARLQAVACMLARVRSLGPRAATPGWHPTPLPHAPAAGAWMAASDCFRWVCWYDSHDPGVHVRAVTRDLTVVGVWSGLWVVGGGGGWSVLQSVVRGRAVEGHLPAQQARVVVDGGEVIIKTPEKVEAKTRGQAQKAREGKGGGGGGGRTCIGRGEAALPALELLGQQMIRQEEEEEWWVRWWSTR